MVIREEFESRFEVATAGQVTDQEREGSVGGVEGAAADEVVEEVGGGAAGGGRRGEREDVAKEILAKVDVGVVEVEVSV